MKKHRKHTNLERRNNDNFAPNEIAILGTNCGIISDLVNKVSQKISNYKLAYFDASHAKDVTKNRLSAYTFQHEGNLQITTSGNKAFPYLSGSSTKPYLLVSALK